jgi:hypothetical protein
MHWIVPLLYSIYWLLLVLAVVCHHQGVKVLPYVIAFSILLFYYLWNILYIIHFYHILTHCIFWCYCVILLTVHPVVIMTFNLFYSTQGVLHTNSFIRCIFRYTTYFICISSTSDGFKKLPDDVRLLPKHVGASMLNKGVVQFSALCLLFLLCRIQNLHIISQNTKCNTLHWMVSKAPWTRNRLTGLFYQQAAPSSAINYWRVVFLDNVYTPCYTSHANKE